MGPPVWLLDFKDSNVLLKGFGLSGYRSIGDELVKVAPLKKVNLIIGKNNAGKSNIIKFLSQQYSYFGLVFILNSLLIIHKMSIISCGHQLINTIIR